MSRQDEMIQTELRRLLLGKFLVNLRRQFMHVRVFAKLLDSFRRCFHVHSRMFTKFVQHLKHHGQFLFRKHPYLKVEM